MAYDESHTFTKEQLERIFTECKNKTLGEVDKNHVFNRTINNPINPVPVADLLDNQVQTVL